MKLTAIIYLPLLALFYFSACNSGTGNKATADSTVQTTTKDTVKKVVILDGEALKLFDSTTVVEVIAEGYKWTEGPLYIRDSDYLLFSDIPNNSIFKWKEGAGASLYLKPSGHTGTEKKEREPGSNGLLLNAAGELVLCQHGDRRIAKMAAPLSKPAPSFITLVRDYQGKRLNSPNDAVYSSMGDLYFTDPPYGLDNRMSDTAKQLGFQGVYRLTPKGQLDLIIKDLKFPNGLAFSPDGKVLYVSNSDSTDMKWMKYEVDDKGMVKNGTVLYQPKEFNNTDAGNPDGMKVNKQGYLFAAGPQGVWVFNPAGKLIAHIYTWQKTSNCGFTPDEKTLFITGSSNVIRVKLK